MTITFLRIVLYLFRADSKGVRRCFYFRIEVSPSVDSIVHDKQCDIFISFLLTQRKISDIFII